MSNFVTRHRVANINLLDYANKNRSEGFFSDVTIVAGNERIPANRLVLSCYSTYLEGMFKFFERNPPIENLIELDDIEGNVLQSLVDFIYTGSISISEQNVKNLLSGAHYLKLTEVKQFCFEYLQSRITAINALDFLKIATFYENKELQKDTHQYISINLDKVLQTEDFKQLSNEELISCISKLNRNQAKESLIFQAMVAWTKHDKDTRKAHFLELFKMIHFHRVPSDYLEEVILEEELVTTVTECHKLALSILCKLLKEQNVNCNASKLLCVGGKQGNAVLSKVSVVYELENKSLSVNYPNLPKKTCCHCSLLLKGYIYCIGGDKKKDVFMRGTDSVWKLNSKLHTSGWKQVALMHTKRCAMGAAVYGDVIVVTGGVDENRKSLTSAEVYLPLSNAWNVISPLKQQRYALALVSCYGYLYAIGGWDSGSSLSSVERLSDLNEEWINNEPMQTPRYSHAAVNCDGIIYAIGGRSGLAFSTTLKTVEKYDASTNEWKFVSDMNFKRCALAACVLRNKIYVVGGFDAVGKTVTKIECYDPMRDIWSIVGNTTDWLWHHTLVAV